MNYESNYIQRNYVAGKVIIITGASSDVGCALIRRLWQQKQQRL